MAKAKSQFFCQSCGYESAKWLGKCPSCQQWNSFVEEIVQKSGHSQQVPAWKQTELSGSHGLRKGLQQAQTVQEIVAREEPRVRTHDQELDRVLGGGIVPGSLILIGGEPGIGKSTLMLQVALTLKDLKTLYISGEESSQQIKMRAERIVPNSQASCYILPETFLQDIFKQVRETEPDLLIIDSIQTLYTNTVESAPGSVAQVRECTAELLRFAKESNIPVFIVGHITKDGAIAGPKVLEHMVDTVIQFEGDRHHTYRILRTIKNRFGSSSELGIYEMVGSGLRQVSNPSEILLSQRDKPTSGVAIAAMMEGVRPLLIEVQALVGTAAFGTPQRSTTGFDSRRMNMLLAVLEKRLGFRLSIQDVFLNIAGGFKVEDPAIDLAVLIAVISSQQDIALSGDIVFAAEVGLSGEIRAVNRIEQRISEAAKLGFNTIYISKFNMKGLEKIKQPIQIKPFSNVEEVFRDIFG